MRSFTNANANAIYLSSGAVFTQLKMIIKLYVQFKSEIGREMVV